MRPTSKGRDTQNKRRIDCEMLEWRRHEATLLSKMHKAKKLSRKINSCEASMNIKVKYHPALPT